MSVSRSSKTSISSGTIGGYAPLDSGLLIPSSYLRGNAPDRKPWNFTPPTTANAMDDEFGDATSQSGPVNGLDAKWSKHNLGTSTWLRLSDSYAPGALGLDIPTGQTAEQWIYQAVPAGACTFSVRFTLEYASDRQMFTLAILDTSGTGVGFRIDTGAAPQIMNITTWSQTSTVVALTPAWNSGTEYWFSPMTLFLRSDGAHNYYASQTLGDRALQALLPEVTQNRTFTDAYVGFGRSFGTGVSKVTLDYFRRTA